MATLSDSTNAFMWRCLAVVRRCDPMAEFHTIFSPAWGKAHDSKAVWHVGFYERDYGKHNAEGPW